METVIDSKGKIVIPPDIRRQLGIKDKSFIQIDVNIEKKQIIITPLRGKYRGRGLMKAFMAEKELERF